MVTTASGPPAGAGSFVEAYRDIAERHYERVLRYLTRLSGDPELAADLVQETFLRLHRRGSPPDAPAAWLVTVANNLFRNARAKRARRTELLTEERGRALHSAPGPPSDTLADADPGPVRAALERISERDRRLLLLLAEGFSYRDMAEALELKEGSVGTFLARAKKAFRRSYEETRHAP